jgi:biotin carboxyl carrier protein
MYFKAESNKINYEVNISESTEGWKISIKPENKEWLHYAFSHDDYKYMDDTISFIFNNHSYLLDVTSNGVESTVYTRGAFRTVKLFNEEKILHESLKGRKTLGAVDSLVSEMPGKIVKIYAVAGTTVKAGEPLLVMEAMKMENEMRTDHDVKIKTIHVKEGSTIETGTTLITFEK